MERNGYKVTFLVVDGHGKLDLREFVRALAPRYSAGHDHARRQPDRGNQKSHRGVSANCGEPAQAVALLGQRAQYSGRGCAAPDTVKQYQEGEAECLKTVSFH